MSSLTLPFLTTTSPQPIFGKSYIQTISTILPLLTISADSTQA